MSELRFLYITDTHLRGTSPKNRRDDYPSALFHKLSQFVGIVKETEAKAVLFGGDLFDHPEPASSLVHRAIDMIYETGVDWYVVAGNHDIYGYNLSTISRTTLGLLHQTGVVHLIDPEHAPVELFWENPSIAHLPPLVGVWGASYHYGIDGDTLVFTGEQFADCDPLIRILILHATVTPNPFPAPHVTVDSIRTNFDVILTGHYHPGVPLTGVKQKAGRSAQVVNPGAFGRVARAKDMYERPGGLLITVTRGEKFAEAHTDIRRFSLDATPTSEVFEKAVDVPIVDTQIAQFVAELRETSSQLGAVDLKATILEVAKKMKLKKSVVDLAVEVLDDCQGGQDGN